MYWALQWLLTISLHIYVIFCNKFYVEGSVWFCNCVFFQYTSIIHIASVYGFSCFLPDILLFYTHNKATRSPEISREQVQKLTPQFLLYIYIGYRFPLSLSTIWGNHLPVNFMFKFPTCISTIWRNHLPHLTSK